MTWINTGGNIPSIKYKTEYKKQKTIIVILDYLLKRQLFKKSLHEKMKTFYILILISF
jgi:hypothetical protein